jgi:hypothetical protein
LGRLVPALLMRISNGSAASRTFDTAVRSVTSSSRELAESRLRYCSNGTFHSRHYEKTARDMSRVARAPLRVLPLAV